MRPNLAKFDSDREAPGSGQRKRWNKNTSICGWVIWKKNLMGCARIKALWGPTKVCHSGKSKFHTPSPKSVIFTAKWQSFQTPSPSGEWHTFCIAPIYFWPIYPFAKTDFNGDINSLEGTERRKFGVPRNTNLRLVVCTSRTWLYCRWRLSAVC